MRLTRRAALGGLLATSPVLASPPALAQKSGPPSDWPTRRLRLLVPSAAGGYEVYARILAPRLAELLGQPVVVDNKPGANGIIGMQEVQRSAPDGYTFMFAHVGAISIGSSIYPNMPLDPVDDLASISVAVTSPLVWVVTPSLPFRTMPEFIAGRRPSRASGATACRPPAASRTWSPRTARSATGSTCRPCPIAARRSRCWR